MCQSGLCATLFNMGYIHLQNKQQQQALDTWLTVYRLARKINLAQALHVQTQLASQLGLPGEGLEVWKALSKQVGE